MNGNTFRGSVSCVNIEGNRAVVGGMLTQQPSGSPTVATPYVIYVEDNGPPGSATPDQISTLAIFPPGDPGLAYLPARFPEVCPSVRSQYGYAPLTSGDFSVG